MQTIAALIAFASGYGISHIEVRPCSTIGGLFGRYGSGDLVVMLALTRLFETCVEMLPPGSPRLAVLDQAAVEALADAERSTSHPPSVERIRAPIKALRIKINSRRTEAVEAT